MTAAEALDRADEFLLEFDPEGVYRPGESRLVAMAILYGERLQIIEGLSSTVNPMAGLREEIERAAAPGSEAVTPIKSAD